MRLLALMITISFIHIMTVGKIKSRGLVPSQGMIQANGQTENAIKHRIIAADRASNASDASIFGNKFCIPLDFVYCRH